MTKGAAIKNFFESFGLPAYPATSVPDDVVLPYLTYEQVFNTWEAGEVSMTVNLWYYTESEAIPTAKAQEISTAIGLGGKVIPCDGGAIWIKRGSPWCQFLSDAENENIKRRYLNVSAEFFTQD